MNLLIPNFEFSSILDIEYKFLKENNIEYLILDIDNTLVADNEPYPDENSYKFLKILDENNIKYCFVSNNSKERVESFNSKFNKHAIHRANKPLPHKLKKAMKIMGSNKENTAFVGDQLFTDMMAGNLAGVKTILVKPINEKKENKFFKLKRKLENKIYTRRK